MTIISEPNEYSVEGMVSTDSGNQRVIMTQSIEGTQQAYSENSVECIVEDSSGNKQRCVCVNDFGGGGGSGGVTSVNGQTGDVTLTASDVLQPTASDAGKYMSTDGMNVTWESISGTVNNRGMYASGVVYNSGDVVRYYVDNTYSNFMCVSDNVTTVPTSSGWVQFETNKIPFSLLSGYYPILSYRYTSASDSSISNIGAVVSQSVSSYNNLPTIQTYSGELKLTSGGLTGNNSSLGDYTVVDGTTGLIPAARLADLPTADGTYTLKLTISGGVPALSWVAD